MEEPQSDFLEEDITYLRQIVVNMVNTTVCIQLHVWGWERVLIAF